MKKMIAILLAFVLCVSTFAVSASAALPPVIFGDLNWDYIADVLDVTLIQRGLVGVTEFGYNTQLRADFDRDGTATVLDATWIQRKEAGVTIPEGFGGEGYADIEVTSFYADYDCGKAAVGVPVTFTARANCGEEGSTYEFYIDGEQVRERSEKNTFTYTFSQSGDYDVSVKAYNRYGFFAFAKYSTFANAYPYDEGREYYEKFHVVDSNSYDELTLISVSRIDWKYSFRPGFDVRAIGGRAPYTYSFIIPDMTQGDQYCGTDVEWYNSAPDQQGWELRYDDDNIPYLYHDYSAQNTVFIPLEMFAPCTEHEVIVQAKDADGNLTGKRTMYLNDAVYIG